MFKLKRPCKTCPFTKANGRNFGLGRERVLEIIEASAFQCHGTVDYDEWDDPIKRQGAKPQQCAGLMSLLYRAGKDNQIMQVAERFGVFDPEALDHSDVYETIEDCLTAHELYHG